MKESIAQSLAELTARYPKLEPLRPELAEAFRMLKDCYENGGKLLVAGNGGSCADAEHIVGELMKEFKRKRPLDAALRQRLAEIDPERGPRLAESVQRGLPAVALSSHPSLNTAFLNDVGSEGMFAQQINVLGREGDVFLAISTSGNSRNIACACVMAKAKGIQVLGLTGKTGGVLRELADLALVMPETETYRIQELHLPVYHWLCMALEEQFFAE